MSTRLLLSLVAVGGVVTAAAVWAPSGTALQEAQQGPAAAGYTAPVDVDTAGLPGPQQPVFFRHDIHAGQYQLDCQYCHVNIEVSPKPGIPSMSACAGCHQIVGRGNPEVEKVMTAWSENRPIEWDEVHYLSPFVHFPHHRHVVAGLDCAECHGDVARMPQVYQFASLKMGWCLNCHEQRQVSTDCTMCHY